jgi:hypothetical protein
MWGCDPWEVQPLGWEFQHLLVELGTADYFASSSPKLPSSFLWKAWSISSGWLPAFPVGQGTFPLASLSCHYSPMCFGILSPISNATFLNALLPPWNATGTWLFYCHPWLKVRDPAKEIVGFYGYQHTSGLRTVPSPQRGKLPSTHYEQIAPQCLWWKFPRIWQSGWLDCQLLQSYLMGTQRPCMEAVPAYMYYRFWLLLVCLAGRGVRKIESSRL